MIPAKSRDSVQKPRLLVCKAHVRHLCILRAKFLRDRKDSLTLQRSVDIPGVLRVGRSPSHPTLSQDDKI